MDRTLIKIEVTEIDRGREYWATRPWVSSEHAGETRKADVVILPWVDFREGHPALFPQGTTDLYHELKGNSELSAVAIAIDPKEFLEIALHGRETRFPTLLVNGVLLPLLVAAIVAIAERAVDNAIEETEVHSIELELIVENEVGRCISIKYKGPSEDLPKTVLEHAGKCLPPQQKKRNEIEQD